MISCILNKKKKKKKQQHFKCLLSFRFTPDPQWNLSVQSIAKSVEKIVGSFCHAKNYETLTKLYLYMSQIRPSIAVKSGLLNSYFPALIKLQVVYAILCCCWWRWWELSLLCNFFHTCNITSLSLLPWQMPPVQDFMNRTCHATFMEVNHCRTNSHMTAYLKTLILISSRGSIIIHLHYPPHKNKSDQPRWD